MTLRQRLAARLNNERRRRARLSSFALSLYGNGESGFLFDFEDPELTFQDADGETPALDADDPVGLVVGLFGGVNAVQTTAADRPLRRAGGYVQAVDTDGLFTTVKPNTGDAGNTLAAKIECVDVAATEVFVGTRTTSTNRWFLSRAADGRLSGSCGSMASASITGGSNLDGLSGVALIRHFPLTSIVELVWNEEIVFSDAYTGTITSDALPMAILAENLNGALSLPSRSGVFKIMAIDRALTDYEVGRLTYDWSR